MSALPLREQLMAAGASPSDLAWFDEIGWDDARVPPAEEGDLADYERREALLNETIEGLTFAERGESQAGRLAAAIGARLADFREEEEEEGEGEEDDADER